MFFAIPSDDEYDSIKVEGKKRDSPLAFRKNTYFYSVGLSSLSNVRKPDPTQSSQIIGKLPEMNVSGQMRIQFFSERPTQSDDGERSNQSF